MQNSAGGEIILTELLDVQRLSEMAQSQTPQKTINDVCRLCGDNFIDKKNKHRLILCHDDFKPPYTLAHGTYKNERRFNIYMWFL